MKVGVKGQSLNEVTEVAFSAFFSFSNHIFAKWTILCWKKSYLHTLQPVGQIVFLSL